MVVLSVCKSLLEMEKSRDTVLGIEDESGQPVSALSILSLLERVSTIIDGVQASQQRMEERQHQLEASVATVQSELLKLVQNHGATATTVDKLLQKARRVSAHVKEVRSRVEKQNVRVKKVETTQDELLTRNKFRVVIYQVYIHRNTHSNFVTIIYFVFALIDPRYIFRQHVEFAARMKLHFYTQLLFRVLVISFFFCQ